jgi:2-polyprenyl-3-methyl-5-hydroxy-6-metoxy-1,4-benzoquinol methylase
MSLPGIDAQPRRAWCERHFRSEQGVHVPLQPPIHRDDDYDPAGFDNLLAMQRDHFWYRGRHRLLLEVLRHELGRRGNESRCPSAIDLGGGCGGWVEYVHRHAPGLFEELALGDSSMRALHLAGPVLGEFAERFQVDLLNLAWSEAWDAVFLLDVIEHIADDAEVLRQAGKSLRPGGLLFVTTPALQAFWTYNDDYAKHQRRYAKQDFHKLALATGLELVRTDYFMFFLSPALLASRLLMRPRADAAADDIQATLARTHRVPARPVNAALTGVLAVEAMLVNRLKFPWGTSILAVLRRPPGGGQA